MRYTVIIQKKIRSACTDDQQNPAKLIPSEEISKALEGNEKDKIKPWAMRGTIVNAKLITHETFALVLRRIGDKNVLPHVHIMLAFLSSLASSRHVSDEISKLIDDAPWTELVAFLNTLLKTENQIQSQSQPPTPNIAVLAPDVFPGEGERGDELPLPEDYLIRGLIWAQNYFPREWFGREHDEEKRYLELASTGKDRIKRVLGLSYGIAKHARWITYDRNSQGFSLVLQHVSSSVAA